METFETLVEKIKSYNQKADFDLIKKAFDFAFQAHKGQKRISSEPYINHPLAVALVLADLKLDINTIAAGVLHDTIEDSDTIFEELEKKFGTKISQLVLGVTKLGEVDFSRLPKEKRVHSSRKIENLRRLFIATAQDPRVILIKLADRLCNMRTLQFLPKTDQKRISAETLEIFAPIADRLGIGTIKAELEDLAFKYLEPKEFKETTQLRDLKISNQKSYINKGIDYLKRILAKHDISAEMDGRIKHLYSLYKKLKTRSIDEIYDLYALRIIVPNVSDCYRVLGIIHENFKPLIGRIKDYIALPKPNNYRSLHTTVFFLDGKITEIQIRTKEMHDEAENGIAAHWYYNEQKIKAKKDGLVTKTPQKQLSWIKQLTDLQKEKEIASEFTEGLKTDILTNRIFVFSPKGDIFDLPENATPIDFAYTVHSELGHKCIGAKVNNKIVHLNYKLQNRDIIAILTSKIPKGPKHDWLNFIQTNHAKQKIKSWFRKQKTEENTILGQNILTKELQLLGFSLKNISQSLEFKNALKKFSFQSKEDLFLALGEGSISSRKVIQSLFPYKPKIKEKFIKDLTKKTPSFSSKSLLINFAKCCNPQNNDPHILGYVTRDKGVMIHRVTCKNIKKVNQARILTFLNQNIKIRIEGDDRVGLVKDISSIISKNKVNIEGISTQIKGKRFVAHIDLSVQEMDKLFDILNEIMEISGVEKASRIL